MIKNIIGVENASNSPLKIVLLIGFLAISPWNPGLMLTGIVGIGILWLHGVLQAGVNRFESSLESFKRDNQFNEKYALRNNFSEVVLFDTESSRAIIANKKRMQLLDFSQITGWEWQWKEKNAQKSDNVIVLKIADMNNPLFKIQTTSKEAPEWMQKIKIILEDRVQ